MSNLCSTIVDYWHRLLPQRGPASEGAARVELSNGSETIPTSCEKIPRTISEGQSERFTLKILEIYKVDTVNLLQNQAMHKTVD